MNPKTMNTTALAFLGDAVYEVYVRKHVLAGGQIHADRLHRLAVRYVCADGQATALKAMMTAGFLTEDELALVRRARNHRSASKPKNADPVVYKLATAFEALLGALYLAQEQERLTEVMAKAVALTEQTELAEQR